MLASGAVQSRKHGQTAQVPSPFILSLPLKDQLLKALGGLRVKGFIEKVDISDIRASGFQCFKLNPV